jgi:hypothetical protein
MGLGHMRHLDELGLLLDETTAVRVDVEGQQVVGQLLRISEEDGEADLQLTAYGPVRSVPALPARTDKS